MAASIPRARIEPADAGSLPPVGEGIVRVDAVAGIPTLLREFGVAPGALFVEAGTPTRALHPPRSGAGREPPRADGGSIAVRGLTRTVKRPARRVPTISPPGIPFGADVEADAERTAAKIATVLQGFFERQGWVVP